MEQAVQIVQHQDEAPVAKGCADLRPEPIQQAVGLPLKVGPRRRQALHTQSVAHLLADGIGQSPEQSIKLPVALCQQLHPYRDKSLRQVDGQLPQQRGFAHLPDTRDDENALPLDPPPRDRGQHVLAAEE